MPFQTRPRNHFLCPLVQVNTDWVRDLVVVAPDPSQQFFLSEKHPTIGYHVRFQAHVSNVAKKQEGLLPCCSFFACRDTKWESHKIDSSLVPRSCKCWERCVFVFRENIENPFGGWSHWRVPHICILHARTDIQHEQIWTVTPIFLAPLLLCFSFIHQPALPAGWNAKLAATVLLHHRRWWCRYS